MGLPLALLGLILALTLGGRVVDRVSSWLSLGSPPIQVGLLHSMTGPLALSERSLVDAEVLALEEINAAGGLLGRKIEWSIVDGKSDPSSFAQGARRLVDEDKVAAVFGCGTSESRKATREIIEERGNLLFFPGTFEGLEGSNRVIYAGGSANQSAVPAVRWCVDVRKARRFFVVGSDELWSRATAEIVKDSVKAAGAEVVGEGSFPLSGGQVGPIIERIKASRPDFVLNSIIGEINEQFYHELHQAGLTAETCPVMAFGFGEDELRRFQPGDVVGHYAALNYFQSVDRQENRDFIARFKARYGPERTTGDSIVASYNAVRLWAQAVVEGNTIDPGTVMHHLDRQSIDAPEGIVTIDSEIRIAWRPFHLGRARADGQFDVIWSLTRPVRPVLFVATRPHSAWKAFLEATKAELGRR